MPSLLKVQVSPVQSSQPEQQSSEWINKILAVSTKITREFENNSKFRSKFKNFLYLSKSNFFILNIFQLEKGLMVSCKLFRGRNVTVNFLCNILSVIY